MKFISNGQVVVEVAETTYDTIEATSTERARYVQPIVDVGYWYTMREASELLGYAAHRSVTRLIRRGIVHKDERRQVANAYQISAKGLERLQIRKGRGSSRGVTKIKGVVS